MASTELTTAPDAAAQALEAAACCPYQRAMDVLGKRHALQVVWMLSDSKARRFNEIKRGISANPVTLSTRLTELEEEGILERHAYAETPPRVEYKLSDKGEGLLPLMDGLCRWAEKYPTAPEAQV